MSSAAAETLIISTQLLLLCLGALLRASRAAGGILSVPSPASLEHCPTSCGNATFLYPFGTAPGCFRQGFELTCDNTAHPPRLFWANSTTTQILGTDATDHYFAYASIGFSIAMTPGTTTYTRSWESPAKGFTISSDTEMYVVGCDVEVVLFYTGTNMTVGSCTSVCFGNNRASMANESAVPAVSGYCNGLGCCTIALPEYIRGFWFTLSRVAARSVAEPSPVKVFLTDQYEFDASDLYSSWINSSVHTSLEVLVTDQPSCEDASANKETYACSPGSLCHTGEQGGYFCYCNPAVGGNNPYILGGCIEDYNPNPRGKKCRRSCGNMSIPFPFGLEKGCFAHEKFQLSCLSDKFTILDREDGTKFQVTTLSVDEGYMGVTSMVNDSSNSDDVVIVVHTINGVFVENSQSSSREVLRNFIEFSQEFDIRMMWAVTNLTCKVASQSTTYACISAHSECVNVTHGTLYLGYRCECSRGFDGNPYVQGADGCTDIDECLDPTNVCDGICHNTKGGYYCTRCPHGEVFEPTKRKCVTSAKQHNILLGELNETYTYSAVL